MGASPEPAAARGAIWQQDGAVANYLNTSRQAIPLANEQMDAMCQVIGAFGVPTRSVPG